MNGQRPGDIPQLWRKLRLCESGVRAFLPLTEKLSLQAQADIGRFGARSDLTWPVLATVNHTVSGHFPVSAGYKALDADYDHGGYVYDTRLSGPVPGFTCRF